MAHYWGDAKPIETRYAGYRFRSRLEARWAVFLDSIGARWTFEPQGFDLGKGIYYLPDFWLADQRCWLEIKPEQMPDPGMEDLLTKGWALSAQTGCPVFVMSGWPEAGLFDTGWLVFLPTEPEDSSYSAGPRVRGGCEWAACLECGAIGLTNGCPGVPMWCGHSAIGSTPELEEAFVVARSTRFDRAR